MGGGETEVIDEVSLNTSSQVSELVSVPDVAGMRRRLFLWWVVVLSTMVASFALVETICGGILYTLQHCTLDMWSCSVLDMPVREVNLQDLSLASLTRVWARLQDCSITWSCQVFSSRELVPCDEQRTLQHGRRLEKQACIGF